jgi:hypothetical protein
MAVYDPADLYKSDSTEEASQMSFIFAEIPGMQSAAASQVGLATDTANVGAQGQAAGLPVVPPGLDPQSAKNAADIKTYTSQIASQLATGAHLQNIYGESISNSANIYLVADEQGATGINAVGVV